MNHPYPRFVFAQTHSGSLDADDVMATAYITPEDFFQFKVEDICGVYELAVERAKQGELTFSLDEMPGIQALERKMPDVPMKPGRCVKHESEYIGATLLVKMAMIRIMVRRLA